MMLFPDNSFRGGSNWIVCTMNSITQISFFLMILAGTFQRIASKVSTDEFLHAERNDLIQLRESLSSTLNLHSNWTGPPCYNDQSRWTGITCSNSRVIGISLEGIQLTGSLQPTALQNVILLANLSFSNNMLHGGLPTLRGLVHLQNVSFSHNQFSGPIPIDFVSLQILSWLELQDNLLNGTIPPFEQQNLMVFNVSYNFLGGKIPETSVLQRFSTSSYDHNLELCGKPLDKPCPVLPPSPVAPVVPPPSPSSTLSASGPKGLDFWALALVAVDAVVVPFMVIL